MHAFLMSGIAAAALLFGAAVATAQTYPSRPVTLVVAYPPGALTDNVARILQPALSQELKQPVIVENIGGAGGVVGAAKVTSSAPDGHTILVTVNAPIVMAPWMMNNFPFDPAKALKGVTLISETYLALVVRKDSPINTIADVVRLAKANPGKMSFGSAGIGSAHQIAGELLNKNAGIQITHIPYQGGAPAIQDLVGGHIDMSYGTLPTVLGQVQGGALKLVALAEPKRFKDFPNLPTVSETVPGVETSTWVGMLAPAQTPQAIIDRLQKIVVDAEKTPDVISRMAALGMTPVTSSPAEFDRLVEKDLKFWSAAIEATQIPKQ